ncbi:hypothetical protein MP228_008140 [Amoeboaphelidium protococcarum]|nr:hypothetical protein MP228_008140 [Amoeboaphelidium protococcarum]
MSFASSSRQLSPDSSILTSKSGNKDVSQFVKYLLEGSGVSEDVLDMAVLRQELEHLDEEEQQLSPLNSYSTKLQNQSFTSQMYGSQTAAAYKQNRVRNSSIMALNGSQEELAEKSSLQKLKQKFEILKQENFKLANQVKELTKQNQKLTLQLEEEEEEQVQSAPGNQFFLEYFDITGLNVSDNVIQSAINKVRSCRDSEQDQFITVGQCLTIINWYEKELEQAQVQGQQSHHNMGSILQNEDEQVQDEIIQQLTEENKKLQGELQQKNKLLQRANTQIDELQLQVSVDQQERQKLIDSLGQEAKENKYYNFSDYPSQLQGPATFTRELIKRDKKRFVEWKRKSMSALPDKKKDTTTTLIPVALPNPLDCRDIIFDICQELQINDVRRLQSALKDISTSISAIPKMKDFIESVHKFLYSTKTSQKSLKQTLVDLRYVLQQQSSTNQSKAYTPKKTHTVRLPDKSDHDNVAIESMDDILHQVESVTDVNGGQNDGYSYLNDDN